MESIYYVLCWHCHRRCKHCYESRFHPYVRDELESVVSEAEDNAPRIVDHLPERMTYLDRNEVDEHGRYVEKTGRIIISGGEVLTDPVRERVLYPTLERLYERYRDNGGVQLVVQTTGDLVTERIIGELLSRHVWMISVAGMDDYHVGMQGEKREPLKERLTRWFEAAGATPAGADQHTAGPHYGFFGATEDAWIGKLWPRGRAWENDLSKATLADNFCNAWSGGLGFLEHAYEGSEVSIDPTGDVYPCCLKTEYPLGNLVEEPLVDVLESLAGHPVFEAINAGKPERMGLRHGWSVDDFVAASETTTVSGRPYRNLCIGCDAFHRQVLGPELARLRAERLAASPDRATEVLFRSRA